MLLCLILACGQSSLDEFSATASLKIFDHLGLGLVLMDDAVLMHELMVRLVEPKVNVLCLLSGGRPVVLVHEEGIVIVELIDCIPSPIILL